MEVLNLKKTISRIIDIVLIALIIFLSFRLLQQRGIIKTKVEKMEEIPAFAVEDVSGEEITDEILKDYDLTVISVWSTTCGACFYNLEALNELYSDFQNKNVNILGVVTNGERKVDEVEKISKDMKLQFPNLIPDEQFNKDFVKGVVGTPTILFVDKDGNILDTTKGSYGTDGDIKFINNKVNDFLK